MRHAILGLLALLPACTHAHVLQIEPTPLPFHAREAVPILLDEPKQPYRSIALVEVTGELGASLQRMGRRLASEAAKLGGDAVLVTHRSAVSGTTIGPAGESFSDSRLMGKVIVYLQPVPR
jgi:hypothetical protein